MTREEKNRYLLAQFTGVSISSNCAGEYSSHVSTSDLSKLADIFDIWKKFISPRNYSRFLHSLLFDLSNLQCCAVSVEPNSPCYIGKMAGCVIQQPLPNSMYTAHSLGTPELKTRTDRVFAFYSR